LSAPLRLSVTIRVHPWRKKNIRGSTTFLPHSTPPPLIFDTRFRRLDSRGLESTSYGKHRSYEAQEIRKAKNYNTASLTRAARDRSLPPIPPLLTKIPTPPAHSKG
ncbi:MAG: hypothetical protein ACKON9_13885, partial [Planctomycetaceae bacterium]